MEIRHARIEEIDTLMSLYEQGRRIMRKNGNLRQWTKGYPTQALVMNDIALGHSFVCTDESGSVVGVFAFIRGTDPTYTHIYHGAWADDTRPYGVIHRLASTEESRGVAAACFSWCYAQISNLRADTHRDNLIMQHVLRRNGFRYCGIIHLANGDERLAYQKL